MSITELRKKVIDAIYLAASRSKIDLSMISKDDKEHMVENIANEVLFTFDAYISESEDQYSMDGITQLEDEEIIWKGRPFLAIAESYVVTSERIKIIKGLISRKVENFELIRIQDIDYKQNIGERIMDLGDISIRGHDSSDPNIVLRNISKPEEVYELLRKSWLQARKRHGLQFREYM